MPKRILILTAGFGEGHNAAARGIEAGLAAIAPEAAEVERHDLFAETYGVVNDWARRGYLTLINRAPRLWSQMYDRIDRRDAGGRKFPLLFQLKNRLQAVAGTLSARRGRLRLSGLRPSSRGDRR